MSFLHWLATHKDAFEAIQSVVTVAALIIAGVWAYQAFIRNRLGYPRAKIEHRISGWLVSDAKRLLRVCIRIENTSQVLLRVQSGFTWVQLMKPWPPGILDKIAHGSDAVEPNENEIQWPIIAERKLSMGKSGFEIEPCESDDVVTEFVLDSTVEQVLVYTHLENPTKRRRLLFWRTRKLGWNFSTVYPLCEVAETDQKRELLLNMNETQSGDSSQKPGTKKGAAKPRPPTIQPTLPKSQSEAKPKPPGARPAKRELPDPVLLNVVVQRADDSGIAEW